MNKNRQGGILIYVLVLWGVLLFFLGLILTLFSSSVASVKQSGEYLQHNFLLKNLFENTLERYLENPLDEGIYTQHADLVHQVTRYRNDQIIRLNSQNTKNADYIWEFSKSQKELAFVNLATEAPYPNNLNSIKNFAIFWDMKTDDAYSMVKQYNADQKTQETDVRIDLIKISGDIVHRCFLSSGAGVTVLDPGVLSPFKKEILLDESFFQDPSLASDCSTKDPLDTTTLLNSNGVLALDFDNVSYLLKVTVLNGETLVQVAVDGNDSYIPTETLYFNAYLEKGGGVLDKQIFIGGIGSLVFSLLSDGERVYNSVSYTDPLLLTAESRMYFLRQIFEKY